jgi:2-polyprenyl-3-methyl-5-hydroxy-6-metoxy-1,4-benzoquinol methylase
MEQVREDCILFTESNIQLKNDKNKMKLQHLYTLPNFPVSMSCVPLDFNDYKYMDMIFEICPITGFIQLKKIPSMEDIYITSHNTSYGGIWDKLFDNCVSFIHDSISDISNIQLLEIGGGSLKLASKLLQSNLDIKKYTVYEKNLSCIYTTDSRIELINEYFLNTTQINDNINIVIHSHVLEHVWNPVDFIESISKQMKNNAYHCFIVPNLQETFNNKYTNALNFEHSFFITEPFIDTILHNNNFDIIKKEYYLDHSILYMTKYVEKQIVHKPFPNMFDEYHNMAMSFYDYHKEMISNINTTIASFDGEIYLFGAHIFSQFLIAFGLDTSRIKGILDNSTEKNNKKLYGTDLCVYFPDVIEPIDKVCVILKVASYHNEIKEQLIKINPNVNII